MANHGPMCDQQAQENPAPREDLLAMLAALEIHYREHRHDAVFMVEEAKDLRGALPDAHCKSLFVRDKKGTSFLVVCLENRRLDMKAPAGLLEAKRLSFASPGRLRAAWRGIRLGNPIRGDQRSAATASR